MSKFDRTVIVVYTLAMSALLVLGSCSIDLPVFIFGAVIAFISSIAIIKQTEKYDE